MAATTKPLTLKAEPGIRRDGTQFDGNEFSDGLWCRFYRGRPKKMGGYRAVTTTLPEVCRGMNSYTQQAINYLHLGGASTLTQVQTDQFGNPAAQNARTPAAFAANVNNLWQLDVFNNSTTVNQNQLVANAGQNLGDISNAVETPIYAGLITATTALTATAMPNVAGGLVMIAPYLFGYSIGGRVDVSAPNSFATLAGSAFITTQKIVKGLPLRGQGGPAAIFWSLDAVIVATFDQTITTGIPFRFNTVSSQSSILSSQGVIEYDGVYFWMGVDRFLMFNGVVREVPNSMNLSFFFDNINLQARQKAFAFKVPRWGEVWFCFPLGNSTECNHAVIYNVRENTWYDTALPGSGRSSGIYASVYTKPFMTDLGTRGSAFTLWQHETGTDMINGSNVQPVNSFFTTNEFNMLDTGLDKELRVDMVEPDLVQVGPLTLTVEGRSNARASDLEAQSQTFPDNSNPPLTADQQVLRFKTSRRLMRFTIESNTAGGDYYMGKTIAHVEPAGGRITQ